MHFSEIYVHASTQIWEYNFQTLHNPFFLLFHGPTAPSGSEPPQNRGFTIIFRHTPQSVGLLWTSDRPNAETPTWQHTTFTRDRQPSPRQDSNPQPRKESSRRPTPFIINNDVKICITNHSLFIHIHKISANKQRDCIITPFHTLTTVPKLCPEKPIGFAVGFRMVRRFLLGLDSPSGPKPPHIWGFRIKLRQATLGRTPLYEWSARRRDLYLTMHNTHKRKISMPPARFEPVTLASERPQTHALDRETAGISGSANTFSSNNF